MTLEWMYWTLPTALFFIGLFCVLAGMAVWQTLSPSVLRRGFLPMSTTPGDRLFIGIVTAIYIHLAWLGFTDLSIWIIFPIALVWLAIVTIWG